jgi:hypothetical protein
MRYRFGSLSPGKSTHMLNRRRKRWAVGRVKPQRPHRVIEILAGDFGASRSTLRDD